MADNMRVRGLLEWSLAAFHTAFLFAGLMALLYAGGNLGRCWPASTRYLVSGYSVFCGF